MVTLYSRAGCCLCDEARLLLADLHDAHPGKFSWQECDIEGDDRLHRAYLERIPVLTIDGQEEFELVVDESELQRRLGIVGPG